MLLLRPQRLTLWMDELRRLCLVLGDPSPFPEVRRARRRALDKSMIPKAPAPMQLR
jgi:hypothetical protein